jgi:Domain of unknown function (DUF6457)
MFEEWVEDVRTELGLQEEVDVDLVLNLARDVAHGVERRAAPVAAFLAGLAAGLAGGGRGAEEAAVAKVRDVSARHSG